MDVVVVVVVDGDDDDDDDEEEFERVDGVSWLAVEVLECE